MGLRLGGTNMEEVIDDIIQYIKKKTSEFGYMDQATMYEELEGRMTSLYEEALMDEYMSGVKLKMKDDEYLLDGV